MKTTDKLMDMLCKELDEIAEKGEMSAGDLDTVYKLIVSKEKLLRAEEIEEDGGYSQDGSWRAAGSYSRDGGDSYARDGYSRENNYRGRYSGRRRHYVRGHYSYAEGREDLMNRISEMMDGGDLNEQEKQSLRRAMDDLR